MTDEQFQSIMTHFAKLDTLKQWQENHDKTSLEWRESLDKRIEPVEDFVRNVSWVYKFLLGLAALIGVLLKVWDWITAHYKA